MKKIYVFVLLFVGMIISLLFDKAILDFLIQFRYESLNWFFVFISYLLVTVFLAIIVSLIYFWKKWKNMFIFWSSVILSFIFATLFKFVFMRVRPDVLSLVVETSYSFPSRHTAVLFAFLPILFQEKKGVWVFILALVIAYSRIYLGVHYLGDILGGVILGLIIGYLVIFLEKKYRVYSRVFVTKR